jgi:probable HAF family extracellular repeat protein
MKTLFLGLCCVVSIGFLNALVNAAEFQGLGDLPGGRFRSSPEDISADGQVIVGSSESRGATIGDGREAFVWTPADGMRGLGVGIVPSNAAYNATQAEAVSSDGTVVVGIYTEVFSDGAFSSGTFRWTRDRGKQSIGLIGDGAMPSGNAVSGNGQIIAGTANKLGTSVAGYPDAFRWTEQSGFQLLGMPTSAESFHGTAISEDGSTIAGDFYHTSDDTLLRESFVWREATGFQSITAPAGTTYQWIQARAVSDNGSVVTGGVERSDGPPDAFVWTENVGLTPLKFDHNDGNAVHAYDISGDGKTVVGQQFPVDNGAAVVPMIWDAIRGPRNLEQLLATEFGLAEALEGWRLEHAFAVSEDGTVIAGAGINPRGNYEAWRAVLDPEPVPVLLPGDANLDGIVDEADLKRVMDNIGIGSFWYQGNFDGIGRVDSADLAIVQANMIPEPSTMVLALGGMLCIAAHFLGQINGTRSN